MKWILVLAMFGLVSCGSDSDDDDDSSGGELNLSVRDQCFAIVNGEDSTAFPAVVMILRSSGGSYVSRCTGTFVSDDTLITAAHCVSDTDTGSVGFFLEDCDAQTTEIVESEDVFHHGLTADDFEALSESQTTNLSYQGRDLAVVKFPSGTSSHYISITDVEAQAGDEITMIGFGRDVTVDDSGINDSVAFSSIKKRIGTNTLIEVDDSESPARVLVSQRDRSVSSEAGSESATSSGDSGGPVYLDGKIAGVASTAAVGQTSSGILIDQSTWVNLFSELSIELLEEAIEGGAEIEGWDEFNP